jgi:hypothetical protein
MIRRVVFALIGVGMVSPIALAQSAPATMPPAIPSPPVYATPQVPPKAESAEVPPPPPTPAPASKPNDQAASATTSTAAAQRSIARLNALPRRTSTFQETNQYARRESLMDRGRFANPGGVGRNPEYYTANTPMTQLDQRPIRVARFDQGGGPNRAEQIAAFRAGQLRTQNIQNNINAYGRPYGAFGAGFGFGFGLAGGGLYGGGFR